MAPGAPASVGGLVFLAFTLTSAITIAAARRLPARAVSAIGVSALVPGTIAALAAVYDLSLDTLFCGTILAGIGFGAVTQGTLRQLLAVALPAQRSGTLAAYYIVAYLAMSLPSVAAGLVATDWAWQRPRPSTALWYSRSSRRRSPLRSSPAAVSVIPAV